MPTKILVLETPSFQLGANAGETSERMAPEAFAGRLKKHFEEKSADTLFVLAPQDVRHQGVFHEAMNGAGSVSIAFFPSAQEAIRFLPSLLIFAGDKRALGVKDCLSQGSTIYSETFFNAKAVGTRLDPCFNFARGNLASLPATNAWGCLQSLLFLGLQNLPEQGEKGTGEKVDVQIGADDKLLAFTVRFDLPVAQYQMVKASPLLILPRSAAGVFEMRYIETGTKFEFNCLFFRTPSASERTIEISSFHKEAALESGDAVKNYVFKSFGTLADAAPAEKRVVKGGFKKKFSEQVAAAAPVTEATAPGTAAGAPAEGETKVAGAAPAAAAKPTIVSGAATLKPASQATIVPGTAPPPTEEATTVISSNAAAIADRVTVFKNEDAANKLIEMESKMKALEQILKVREEALAKYTKEANDPLAKRDVITNIKDSQTEGLKSNIKLLETEIEEAKKREKELMKMVDKAVQMKDDAAKKIKELDLKLKQASGAGGSKVQMLEKEIEMLKQKNKELAARAAELQKRKAA